MVWFVYNSLIIFMANRRHNIIMTQHEYVNVIELH